MMNILVIRAPGTNCDVETVRGIKECGLNAITVHTDKLLEGSIDLFEFYALVIPGGFSYGDSVRAGAIWAAKLNSKLLNSLRDFIDDGRPVLGICNGFQVLVELGLLPGWNDNSTPSVALAPNISGKFECRWINLRVANVNNVFLRYFSKNSILRLPIAHSEGRFIASKNILSILEKNGQIAFKYCLPNGKPADMLYPFNPNGSIMDIAGIMNPAGNVLGLMPHPERAVYFWQLPTFPSNIAAKTYFGDGYWIFKSMCDYIIEHFQ
ncbi:MAG: phosphoribosylformylglycinamidine synthase I [Candidatus Methanomethylicota archaeon]|nr:MAG: phosphoribosylformylglycinamidine synthase I [Candidatus Verstraetearchaeota archaeon]